jgi:hypothetical protein
MKKLKRLLKLLLATSLVVTVASFALYWFHRPSPLERTEIYRGVYLTVEELPESRQGSGHVMIAEIHWETPGVVLRNRPYTYSPRPSHPDGSFDPSAPHYRLANADWALWREGAGLLVNTTAYEPGDIWRSIPGMPVRSHETTVVDGVTSHVHPYSYLMYWDSSMDAHQLMGTPPDPQSLNEAVLGIGVQGVQVSAGKARPQAIAGRDILVARTFIGFDPERKILWLIAFENASADFMIQRAIEEGVQYGGMVDSGSSTHLLVGADARGVRSHSGIRNWRPLGAYLVIQAKPL